MTQKVKSTQRGFTLIELVVVIVILGILAATALPKFVSLDTDAKNAVLNGGVAAAQGAAALTYAKNASAGLTPTFASVKANISYDPTKFDYSGNCGAAGGGTITVAYGGVGGSPSTTFTIDSTLCKN